MRVDVTFNGDSQILIECEGGPTICLEHATPGKVVRSTQEGTERRALFVSDAEALVLVKMARYALEKLRLSDESRVVLQGLLPLLSVTGGNGDEK